MAKVMPVSCKVESPESIVRDAQLPSMPSATFRLLELAGNPESTLNQVADTIATDPKLSAQVLALANSVLYNRGTEFTSIAKATAHLGILQIRSLALTMHVFSTKPTSDDSGFDYNYFWRYCLTCGVAAKLIGHYEGGADPEEMFTVALLQDIGVLAFQRAMPERYNEIRQSKALRKRRQHEIEAKMLGVNHADVGATIAAQWGLPSAVCDTIRQHHQPEESVAARICHLSDLVHAVIYETHRLSTEELVDQLLQESVAAVPLLSDMQVQLPEIARSCQCPAWSDPVEREMKDRIESLVTQSAARLA